MTSVALLLEAVALSTAAPVAGVVLGVHSPGDPLAARRMLRPALTRTFALVVAAATSLGVLCLVAEAVLVPPTAVPEPLMRLVVLAAAGSSMAALGLACAAWFDNPLDAAATAVVVAWTVTTGVLVAGPVVELLPPAIVATALTASPATTAAAAAGVDMLRDEWLYRLSPLAHMQTAAVRWEASLAGYITATVAFVMLARRKGTRGPVVQGE